MKINSEEDDIIFFKVINKYLPNNVCYYLSTLFVCGSLYFFLISPVPGVGDAAIYNSHIEQKIFNELVIHWGYYAYGAIITTISPLTTDYTMNLGSTVAAILAVSMVFVLSLQEGGKPWLAFLIAVCFGTSPVTVWNAIYSEVYMLQAGICLSSLWLYRRGFSFVGGVFYAYALTISIASIAIAPLFLLPPFSRNHFTRALCGGAFSYSLFLFFYWEGLFFGVRGLLTDETTSLWSNPNRYFLGWWQSLKQLIASYPLILPWIAWSSLECLRYHLWSARVATILAGTLLMHAVLGGASLQWGFDLIVLPILFLPLLLWLSSPIAFSSMKSYRVFGILILASVFVNGLLVNTVWLQRKIFTEPIKLASIYSLLGQQVSEDVIALGKFKRLGFYQRTNNKPFTVKMARWPRLCPSPGRYIVLDDYARKRIERAFGSHLFLNPDARIKIKDRIFWKVKFTKTDLLTCRYGWGM